MCYHTSLITDTAALEERLGRQMHGEARGQLPIPRTRAFARPWWPVISAEAPRVISWKQWGLIPEWAEHPDAFLERTPTFHTASETAYEEPAFQSAASAGRRCLIPVTSFVEWQHREAEGDAELLREVLRQGTGEAHDSPFGTGIIDQMLTPSECRYGSGIDDASGPFHHRHGSTRDADHGQDVHIEGVLEVLHGDVLHFRFGELHRCVVHQDV